MHPRVRLCGLICASMLAAVAANAQDGQNGSDRIGLPDDWSNRHIIFSQATTFDTLSATQADPRYWQQLYRGLFPQVVAPTPEPIIAQGAVDWSESLSTTALSFTNLVTNPAKYSFNVANPTPNCTSDYVVYTLPTGVATSANVFAFYNLYVNNAGTGTCTGKTPTPLFTYNASQSGGKLDSSPTLSLDGTKIAFIENSASAQFHVLKWKATNISATFGKPYNASALPNCATNGGVAPCEYSVVYSTHTASLSSPYIDYGSDTAYVTDDQGLIAAIHPVFGTGTPAVVYSLTAADKSIMTPPVYDSVSKNVFVADAKGVLYYIRTSASSLGTCLSGAPPCVGTPNVTASNGSQIYDAPLVDSSSGRVFVFSNTAASGSHSAVVQTTTTLSTPRVAWVGPNGTQVAHAGTFNNAYYTSPATGLLYVCGTNASNIPQLYAISFSGTSMTTGTAVHGPFALATAATGCSPLTEVYNQSTSKDFVFLGVQNHCSASITGGCVEEFTVTSGFPASVTGSVAETGGTTGIIIDNVSNGASGNASQTNLYFGTLGAQSCTVYTGGTATAGNCLVKLTQAGLN